MALVLRTAFGVRVCNPANAVAKRYPGPSDFEDQIAKALGKLAASLRLALRTIGSADVRSGIPCLRSRVLPANSAGSPGMTIWENYGRVDPA